MESMNKEDGVTVFTVKFCFQWIRLVELDPVFQVLIYQS